MTKKKKLILNRLYEFKAWLENKIRQYNDVIFELRQEQIELTFNQVMKLNFEEEKKRYSKEIDYWQKLINEAEAALVYVKIQIAFEED